MRGEPAAKGVPLPGDDVMDVQRAELASRALGIHWETADRVFKTDVRFQHTRSLEIVK